MSRSSKAGHVELVAVLSVGAKGGDTFLRLDSEGDVLPLLLLVTFPANDTGGDEITFSSFLPPLGVVLMLFDVDSSLRQTCGNC